MKKCILSITALLLSIALIGQSDEKEILDKFFNLYKDSPMEALDYIYDTNKWIDSNSDNVKQVKGQLSQFIQLVGEYHGNEYITKAEVGECFATYVYLAKYERQPIRFTFEFYKPKDVWVVYSFSYDDSFDADVENIINSQLTKTGN